MHATLKPDETANTKTAHHVFIVHNTSGRSAISLTCGQLDGHSTVTTKKTTSSIEVGGIVGAANALEYTECLVNGTLRNHRRHERLQI